MKRILKLKKIGKSKKYKNNQKISKKVCALTKHFEQFDSPHNTNEYLMNVNSSPFWNDDDEDSIELIPSSSINFNSDTNFETNLFFDREIEITKEKTLKNNNEKEKTFQLIKKRSG